MKTAFLRIGIWSICFVCCSIGPETKIPPSEQDPVPSEFVDSGTKPSSHWYPECPWAQPEGGSTDSGLARVDLEVDSGAYESEDPPSEENEDQNESSFQVSGNELKTIWATPLGGTDDESANRLVSDDAGNVYVTGHFEGTLKLGNHVLVSEGMSDAFVAKMASDGQVVWAVSVGGTKTDLAQSIALGPNGNIHIVGSFADEMHLGNNVLAASAQSLDIFVVKLSPSGQILWGIGMGGQGADFGMGITVDSTGSIYPVGSFGGQGIFGNIVLSSEGSQDGVVCKVSPSGQMEWCLAVGGIGFDSISDIVMDSAGDPLVVGSYEKGGVFGSVVLESKGLHDVFVAKVANTGEMLWAVSGGGTGQDFGTAIGIDSSDNVVVSGSFANNAIFGSTNLPSKGGFDIFVAKYSSFGEMIWASSGGGNGPDYATGLAVDSQGRVLVSGWFEGSSSYGPFLIDSKGKTRGFLTSFSWGGEPLWAASVGNNDSKVAAVKSITFDQLDNLTTTGTFKGTLTLENSHHEAHGLSDIFVWKMSN